METAIDYLTNEHKWKISSDPRTYDDYPNIIGLRNYTENGINYDADCNGYHRAFDLYNNTTNKVPSVTHGTVIRATKRGSFGGEVLIEDYNGYIWVYGHLQRNSIKLKKGDKIRQGDTVGLQGSSNYYDNPMSIHLHLQLLKPNANITDGKWYCPGLQIDRYNINNGNYDPVKEGSDQVGYAFERLPQLVDMRGKLAESTRWSAPRFKIPYKKLERAVHHSATLSTLAGSTTKAFARFHVNSHDWPCIAYKFSIEPHNIIDTPNGPRAVIHYNHSLDVIGYHVGNSNDLAIGIVIAGDYTKEELTDAAMASFADLNNALDADQIAMGGMFPHSAYPGYAWKKCSVYSPKYALATGEKLIGESSSIEVGEGKDEALPETYIVQQGDTLYSIAATEDFTADDLMTWNNIPDPTTLKIGQKLNLKGAEGAAEEKATPYVIGDWETNEYGTQYIKAKGTFTVGGEPIMSRSVGPYILADNEGGKVYPGYEIEYNYLLRSEDDQGRGFVWIEYQQNGKTWWLPYNTWDSKTGAVGEDEWGTFS